MKITLPERGLEALFGPHDQNIKYLESLLSVRVGGRGAELIVEGDEADVATVERILKDYGKIFNEGRTPSASELRDAFKHIADDRASSLREALEGQKRINPAGRKQVTARGPNQKRYLETIEKDDIVFGIGPAGTGKTFLAVAMAVQFLMSKRVNRIVLARPAVEAGEKLGFLPGDLQDKVDPYLRPLYDALFDLVDYERVTKFIEKRVIEVAPLAFMRGRAQPMDSLLMTPEGWRRMGEIKVGDLVVGSDGKPTEVIGVFPQGKKPVYRLSMTDGARVVACGEHLWQVKTLEGELRNKPPRVLETQQMLGNVKRRRQYRYELPTLSEPVEFPWQSIPIDPYSLGLFLGEASVSNKTASSLSPTDAEPIRRKALIDSFISNPHEGKSGKDSAVYRNLFMSALRELGLDETVSSTKFIPEIFLYNSAQVRIPLLQGLLDTDGGRIIRKGRTSHIQYSTTSARLKDDLLFLVRSLGGVALWRKGKAEYGDTGGAKWKAARSRADSYLLKIRLPENITPFRLKTKAEIYERGYKRPMRFIKSIEHIGEAETQCIQVAAPDSLYVTDDFILTHNTLGDAFVILDEAQNTTSEQMKMFLTRIGFGSKAVITGDVTQIDLPSGRKSGLVEAQRVVSGIEGISFVHFDERDVVRHQLVQMVIKAYDEHNKKINL